MRRLFCLSVLLCLIFALPGFLAAERPLVHRVAKGESLGKIAKRYQISLNQLRRWNNLRSDRIFVGQKLAVRQPSVSGRYLVAKGDNLSRLATRFGLKRSDLRRWNNLRSDRIFIGQKLRLTAPEASRKNTQKQVPTQAGTYRVKRGDTLSQIAQRHRLGLSQLKRINNLSSNRIKPGQVLRLKPQPEPPEEDPAEYRVKRGDTLSQIAQRHRLGLSQLKRINNLSSNRIKPGQVLHLKPQPEPPEEDPADYLVRSGDTLSQIAKRYEISLRYLRRLNNLSSDRIYPGQRLRLRPGDRDEVVHVVRYGETLTQIAKRYGLKVSQIRHINGIEGSKIYVDQKLRLRTTARTVHIVERGDALWEIATAYNMSVEELRQLNELKSDRIYPGQELKLNRKKAERHALYRVKAGDNLIEIARLHQMSLAELKQLNNLRSSTIHPGQKLNVRPLLGQELSWLEESDIDWSRLQIAPPGIRKFVRKNGPYYYAHPKASSQRSRTYYEEHPSFPLKTYKQARTLWKAFEQTVSRSGKLSNALDGWHIVLDPGHGGLDPGAVVRTRAGKEKVVYIVEDEYVYDIALRVYVLLRLHGATVTMTLLSPNHLLRNNDPSTRTFVNEKNEVYNSYALNARNSRRQWPRGGRGGNLEDRVSIARTAFAGTPKNRRIFLSFHADINKNSPAAPLVLYYKGRHGTDRTSRAFARKLLPALGAGARVRGQALGVLRNNPAAVKVLIELRNLAHVDEAWVLRFAELRHRDAQKVVKGVLDYVQGQSRAAKR